MSALTYLFRRLFPAMGMGLFAVGCATQPQLPQAVLPEPTPESMGSETIFHQGKDRERLQADRGSATPATSPTRSPSQTRYGLGTAFGESVDSAVDCAQFKRGFLAKPFGVGVLYYNDTPGARAMADYLGTPIRLDGGLITTAKGVLDWGVKAASQNRHLGGYLVDGKVILRGEHGDRYAIVLRNNTRQPVECVVSVDGLDVLDGEPAAYSKRGYIVGPKRTIEIKGFRTSTERVSAFRFGKVADSYAVLRHDDARNVGVIGVAVFSKHGGNPWSKEERPTRRREDAKPFPAQRFAIPPH